MKLESEISKIVFGLWRVASVILLPSISFGPGSLWKNKFGIWISVIGLFIFGWINQKIFDWGKPLLGKKNLFELGPWRQGRSISQVAWCMAVFLLLLEYVFK